MIKEIKAKVMLSHVKQPDTWFGLKYNMNLYRGCQHRCIYCDSRSECYQIENFDGEILVKVNAIELLEKELARKRVKGAIGLGSMNDPYMPVEKKVKLTGRTLELIARFRFPVHIITKSDLVLRDIDLLAKINEVYAAVSFTITAANDTLSKKVEPGAPPTSTRLAAMKALAERNIYTGITLMPVLPFIEDNEENIGRIVELARQHGASYIIPWFGMSLRDRQRAYYYRQLDRLFPGLRQRYYQTFGGSYGCSSPHAEQLYEFFQERCHQAGITTRMETFQRTSSKQLSLF